MQFFRKVLLFTLPSLLLMAAVVFSAPAAKGAEKKKFVVVIDAGHGGSDYGAIENNVNEKDVNLAVALNLGNLIKKKLKDTEVVYTRNSDTFLSLQKRADVANSAKADLFISIHCNSVDRSNKNRANVVGATTYVLGHHKDTDNLAVAQRENSVVELDADDKAHFSQFDPSSDESHIIFEMTQKKNFQNSIRFASDVQKEMTASGRVSRGVKQAGFWVLWSAAMPAALIELDFICNPEQAKFLNSKEGQDKLAQSIFNAVKKYETYYRMSMGQAQLDQNKTRRPMAEESMAMTKSSEQSESTESSEPADSTQEMVAVVLPSSPEVEENRTHRTQESVTKKTDGKSHRRRSSAARKEGASQVLEAVIEILEEPEVPLIASADTESIQSEESSDSSSKSKNSKKVSKNNSKKESVAKPGRREKGKTSGKKGVKQSLNIDYRVLLFVSDNELKANDEAFKGLSPVATFRENNQFKYTYGESSERKEMEGLLKEISALFPEARVIKCYF